ncbi:MAG: hypothetical protein JO366_20990 [Methylobacteriaceae bacterium]|nr:hypothetical protein [Methylobacteriaceae bacterium]MBV9247281.1 hypothetical protein [Methylobacteriaceae bacterium]MBV9637283.1 hypothetical protein [Methylobacteriaceae bacterium]
MRIGASALICLMLLLSGHAQAEDLDTLRKKVDQLTTELGELRARIDKFGPASAGREVKVTDPVFLGAGSTKPSPLSMDDPVINCPPRSFVSAIQVLKTGNTVTQIRYACRGIE